MRHMCQKTADISRRGGGFTVGYYSHETLIYATTQEVINALLADGYEFDDDIIPAPKNKTITTGDTD